MKVFSASFDKRGSYLIVCYQVTRMSRKKINEALQIRQDEQWLEEQPHGDSEQMLKYRMQHVLK